MPSVAAGAVTPPGRYHQLSAIPSTSVHASTSQPMKPSKSPSIQAPGAVRAPLRGFAHHVDHRHPAGVQADGRRDVSGAHAHHA